MFEFRYNRIIEIKEKVLESKQSDLEVAQAASDTIMGEVLKVEQDIAGSYESLSTECLTGKEFSVLKDYLSYLDLKKSGLLEEKERSDNRVKALRMELCALAIELKMLEKLKLRAATTAKKAQNRKDQKLMDELALRSNAT